MSKKTLPENVGVSLSNSAAFYLRITELLATALRKPQNSQSVNRLKQNLFSKLARMNNLRNTVSSLLKLWVNSDPCKHCFYKLTYSFHCSVNTRSLRRQIGYENTYTYCVPQIFRRSVITKCFDEGLNQRRHINTLFKEKQQQVAAWLNNSNLFYNTGTCNYT